MLSFPEFIFKHLTVSVIIGLITFKVISSFLDNIFNGIFYLLTPQKFFFTINKLYDCDKNKLDNDKVYSEEKEKIKYGIYYGSFLRDFIIWFILMVIFYLIVRLLNLNAYCSKPK